MSTSAILPVSSLDFNGASSTASQQTVFNNLLGQLTKAINGGNLSQTQTYLNALTALSPSSASGSNALGAFLSGVASALNDGSATEAQSALATYQSATPAPSSSSTTPNTSATAAQIASGLIMSQIQSNTVNALLGTLGGNAASSSSSSNMASLLNMLNAAYPASGSSNSSTSAAGSTPGSASATETSPYDTLVSALQANLSAGTDPTSTALAYLNSTGNFVNTSA